MDKRILILGGMILIAVVLINFVGAEFWACFDKGEVTYYCNNYKPDKTCTGSNGCVRCMSVYREAENCYIHGVWPSCLQIPQNCSAGGGGTIDSEAPEINLISPLNGSLYNARSVMFSFELNENANVYYLDLINGRGRWTNICQGCRSYGNKRSFSEGLNNLIIRAEDDSGNEAYKNVSFFIDSKDPRILKTLPLNSFADGNFEVQFKEENPISLVLHYGDKTQNVDFVNDCHEERSKIYCDNFVDLEEFDGQQINYWYTLTDIAGNIDESKERSLSVDTTAPVINNPDSFWTQSGRYIYFNLSITENNFDEVSYNYLDSHGIVKEKRLCSILKNGMCITKKAFTTGHYDLTINVLDEAGNSVGVPVSFDVN